MNRDNSLRCAAFDCFSRPELRERNPMRGQLSNLQRNSAEPIALFNHIVPLTLQEFLNGTFRGHARANDLIQQITAVNHAAVSATPAGPPRGPAAKRTGSMAGETACERDRRRPLALP